jgi:hypothetical protein
MSCRSELSIRTGTCANVERSTPEAILGTAGHHPAPESLDIVSVVVEQPSTFHHGHR